MKKEDLNNTYVDCKSWSFSEKLIYMKACIGDSLPHDKICGWACNSYDDLMGIYDACTFIYFSDGMLSQDSCEKPTHLKSRKQLTMEDLIPQTKEVEWVNGLPPVGVECVFTPHNMQWGFNHIEDFTGTVLHYEGEQFVFMLNHNKYKLEGDMVIVSRTDKGDFSKLETQEAKEEREELEAAYDLYFDHMGGDSCHGIADYGFFSREKGLHSAWISTVRKTGYRKESE